MVGFRLLLMLLLSLLVNNGVSFDVEGEWDYSNGAEGPENWKVHFETCGESEQSPINIPNKGEFAEEFIGSLPSFEFQYGNDITYTLYGEKSTVKVDLLGTGTSKRLRNAQGFPFVNGRSGLDSSHQFDLEQFHLHWGRNDNEGSEHSFNSEFYSMELHLVHWNSGIYSSFAEAANNPDGLLVVGVMIKAVENAVSTIDDEFSDLTSAVNASDFGYQQFVNLQNFNLQNVLSTLNTSEYYTYAGSLTTPPCSEVVTWVLLQQPLYVSPEVTAVFRQYEDIVHNFRPVQKGNERRVIDSTTRTYAIVDPASSSIEDTVVGSNVDKNVVALVTPITIVACLALIWFAVDRLYS